MLSNQQINELTIPVPGEFVGFRDHGDLNAYRRHLPHWRQDGATYFATFRQADSIPKEVADSLREEKQSWKERIEAHENPPFDLLLEYDVFLKKYQRVIETSLDECHGSCLFLNRENRELLRSAMLHFDETRYSLFGFVIMPNHCHVLLKPTTDFELEEILGSWKKFTSRRIEGETKPLWQDESHDRIVRDEAHFRKAVRYILKNPLKAHLSTASFDLALAGVDLTALESRPTSGPMKSHR
ncbi:MAG: hypothetical protein HKN23_16710 [Verrucomicrobiales bacterium]|nr:hypothetical protein [Verrucomicrobiales bacterium]